MGCKNSKCLAPPHKPSAVTVPQSPRKISITTNEVFTKASSPTFSRKSINMPQSPSKISINANKFFTNVQSPSFLHRSINIPSTPITKSLQSPKSGTQRDSPLKNGRFLTDYKKVKDLCLDDLVITLKTRGSL